jgi:hypothetical protein
MTLGAPRHDVRAASDRSDSDRESARHVAAELKYALHSLTSYNYFGCEIDMTLRNRFLDAVIDGRLGQGITVARSDFLNHFKEDNPNTTGCFLSNSEMRTGLPHSPTYKHFTLRIREGVYQVHPVALEERMRKRGLI